MESGSLLPEALRYMQQIRQNQDYYLPFALPNDNNNEIAADDGKKVATSSELNESVNALVISLYCIDDTFNILYNSSTIKHSEVGVGDSDDNDDVDDGCEYNNKSSNSIDSGEEERSKQIEIHQKLCLIHSIINSKLLPCYQERYNHTWFAGQGISFGLHCEKEGKGMDFRDGKGKTVAIPHLKAIVKYGPNPIDEYYALAIILTLTHDLCHQYNIHTAVSCWDVDDGQIVLIEGAHSLPSWVDDTVGVHGMRNRVYIVNGTIQLLNPSIKGKEDQSVTAKSSIGRSCQYHLTIKESLFALLQQQNKKEHHDTSQLNMVMKKRLEPFLKVIQNRDTGTSSSGSGSGKSPSGSIQPLTLLEKRQMLKDYVHTAAVVLPLQMALLIRQRPDLLSCAIIQFCSMAPSKLIKKKQKNHKKNNHSNMDQKQQEQYDQQWRIKYENLVFTTLTISKSLYAMLLTAAGQIPPPIKIPKQFKSIELNRMKRQCLLGGEGYAHFRHSIEIGIRLTLGFEWIMDGSKEIGPGNRCDESLDISKDETYERISHHCRIDDEMGGDGGRWIQEAWETGPNLVDKKNDISMLVKCPIWNPEIARGGICPLSHPGESSVSLFFIILSLLNL